MHKYVYALKFFLTVLGIAVAVAGCSKAQVPPTPPQAPTASSEQFPNPQAAKAAAMLDSERQSRQPRTIAPVQ